MFKLIVDLAIAAICIYIAYGFVTKYLAAGGSTWSRLLAAAENSATILWQKFVVLVTGLTGALVYVADFFNEPGIGDTIKSLMQPRYVAVVGIAIAFVSWWARKRTLPGA